MKKGILINLIFLVLCCLVGLGKSIVDNNIEPLGKALIYCGGFSILGWIICGIIRLFE